MRCGRGRVVRASCWAMACQFELILWGRDRRYLEAVAREALDEVRRLDEQLSAHRVLSEVDQVNAAACRAPVKVSPQLFDLLAMCMRISADTDGAFDITTGPLVKAWGFFDRKPRVPPPDETAEALSRVGFRHLTLDETNLTVSFCVEGMEINLGAVGKGYAVDCVARYLREMGVPGALIHSGRSTSYALGTQPDGTPWRLGVAHPLDPSRRALTLAVSDRGVSNSGCTEQCLEADGRLYGHIIDPRTGWPAQGLLSAVALASTASESDALATAFFVLGEEGTRRYCSSHPGVSAVLLPRLSDGCDVEPVIIGDDICLAQEVET
ncbi:MAG: FAD:protein FMN transferase [Armatimonadota bacterium]